jgi:hypothetical protein
MTDAGDKLDYATPAKRSPLGRWGRVLELVLGIAIALVLLAAAAAMLWNRFMWNSYRP